MLTGPCPFTLTAGAPTSTLAVDATTEEFPAPIPAVADPEEDTLMPLIDTSPGEEIFTLPSIKT